MNKNPGMSKSFGVRRISAETINGWNKRFIARRAASIAVVITATLLSATGRVSAESPIGCTDSAISVSLNPSPSGSVHHGDQICYTVCYGATGTPNPCDVGDFTANLFLPNGVSRMIASAASISAGSFFCCPSADPRCNPLLTGADYCYTVDHADEVLSFAGCPPVPTPGIGRVVAYTEGAGESMTPGGDEVSPCATANNTVRHACCEPCSGTCTEVTSATQCPFPSVFHPDKNCNEVECTPLVCPGPVPPCEAGQECSTQTGQCVDLPDPPLSTFCEIDGNRCTPDHCDGEGRCVPNGPPVVCPGPIPPCEGGQICDPPTGLCRDLPDPPLSTFCETDNDLCTPEHCDGAGVCVPNGPPVSCPGPNPPCEAGQVCDPPTGQCVNRPDPPLSTPCEADGNPCTIDHCDGQGLCTLLRSECDDPDFCDDRNVCTEDICDINVPGCCEYRDIPCPPRPCQRIVGCDPVDGCQYAFDCREGTDCCPDDNNPCTHEFCDQATGICGSTPDCTTPDDCNDGLNCTVDTCDNSCCGHEPLCREVEGECFKAAACSDAETCTRADGCQGACFFTAAGSTRCFAGEFGCDQPACTSDADCPAGSACSDSCCGLQCAPLCGNPFPATATAPNPSGGRSSGNATAGGAPVSPICCADGASCDDENACTDDLCVEGCCEYRPHECPERPCFRITGCDPVDGCQYESICTLIPDFCDDQNVCTADRCDPALEGCCAHEDIPCPERPCFRITGCDPVDGCQYESVCSLIPDFCDDQNVCTTDRCDPEVEGCCAHENIPCPERPCFRITGCDPVDGCQYESVCSLIPDFCDDQNVCTADRCDPALEGCCEHQDIPCPERPCFTLVGCNPSNGCEYAPVVCDDPACETCDPTTGVCEDDGRCGGAICRTPGFWGTHARANPDRARSQNITQAVINAAGGSLLVCGECINATVPVNNAASAVEAMCVSPRGAIVLQNARQLTAMALNCVVSGFGADCSGNGALADLFDDCNSACLGGLSVRTNTRCRDEIDCFNNGGRFDPIAGICTDGGPNNCHDRPLVNAGLGLNFDPPGPAGSSDECNSATGNSCSVLDLVPAAGCASKKANGEACCGSDSCP